MRKILATGLAALVLGSGISLAPATHESAQAAYAIPAGTWGGHCYRHDKFVKYYWSSLGQRYQMRYREDGYYYWDGYKWYCGIKYRYYYKILLT